MPLRAAVVAESGQWAQALGDLAAAIGTEKGIASPFEGQATDNAKALAKALLAGERKAILLGNAAAHHSGASTLLALCQWIGEQTGATVGFLTEAANTVGAQVVNALPGSGGLNAGQMLAGGLRAALLLNCEPGADSAPADLSACEMVVTLSPFKANMDISDVLLPIAPFTETSGSFVNAEGRVQSFHAVVRPLGDTRPGWKVLRVLGDLLGLEQPAYETSPEVLAQALGAGVTDRVPENRLSNRASARADVRAHAGSVPYVGIYQLDGIVRRAPSLQLTADAREGASA